MKFRELDPPRRYRHGVRGDVENAHCADLELEPGELVTFVASSGSEFDVLRTRFGYYAGGSLNARLPEHGLRPVLTENRQGRRYLLLVERGCEQELERYLEREQNRVVAWLDQTACPLCGSGERALRFHYAKPPEGETRFDSISEQGYARDVLECRSCGHMTSEHHMDPAALYEREYGEATYGASGLAAAFERIMALPPERSDNTGRVARVRAFAAVRGLDPAAGRTPSVLDVGSGLCVFLARMREAGWDCTALDPDPRAAEHARTRVGVAAVCGRFDQLELPGRFDVVSFNKVLEHVPDPVALLARARDCLNPGGFAYVELPDAEGAADYGPGREEFFIEHLAIYSPASLALLARRAGFRLVELERLVEPSGKFTLRGFLSPQIR